ncbi:MAG TPA: DNA recombination protein RmuC [Niastella sp.]
METIVIALLVLLLLISIVILVFAWKAMNAGNNSDSMAMKYKLENMMTEIARIEAAVKQEIVTNRKETGDNTQRIRTELAASLKNFGELITQTMSGASTAQKDSFHALLNKQSEQNSAIAFRLDQMRETLEKKMAEMQTGNERKLDEMRATVDEKLQKTLETRLGESFKLVSERLEAVHKGLGDMQQLATGVGDLKRVLTNVKSRGVLGEYQLESILEQILTIDQYGRNVKTKEGSNALVEFAIKLPGRGDKDKAVWLPVDSKFPKEDFEALMDAYDQALPDLIEEIRKNFIKGIRKCALDISSKYVDPPNTTDFAILFLPFESLYAEVLRTPGLFESIQREHKIIITGPTTLSALLNSLQMGFRTLAIEKRSGEVWQLLGAVKTEFGNFGGILEKTQKKLQEASNVIEQAGVRSRAIEKKLRAVQELPKDDAVALLGKQNQLNAEQEDENGEELMS